MACLGEGSGSNERTPVRTQSINFFLINESFTSLIFRDTDMRKFRRQIGRAWGRLVENYLAHRSQLVLSILIVVPGTSLPR
jgi:GTP-binding protein EngB required for normal cell division